MEQTKYDIFISYRRIGGKNYARTLKPELEKRGFRVFLDFDELKDGVFDKRIMDAINEAPIFLVILSKGALDRCANEGDWVREEILYAEKSNRHIVPVEFDKTFREFPENLPDEVKSVLGPHQFSQIDTETLLQESIDKMVRDRIKPYVTKESAKVPVKEAENTDGAEIHIEVDADCDLFRFKKLVKSLSAHEDNVIYLKPGKHKLEFSSHEYPDIKESMLLDIPYENYSDVIMVTLLPQIQNKKEEEAAKRKAEEEAKRKAEELRKKEEAKRIAEEEARKKEDELRKEEMVRRAEEERLRKEEEERLKEEQRVREEEARKAAEEKKKKRMKDLDDYSGCLMFLLPLIFLGVGIWAGMKYNSFWLGAEIFLVFGWFSFGSSVSLSEWAEGKKEDAHTLIAMSLLSIIIAIGIHSGIYLSSWWKGAGIGFVLLIADIFYFANHSDSIKDDKNE